VIEIVDRRNKLPAPIGEGQRYQLQANWRWLVRGNPIQIDQVHIALQRVATQLSPSVLELNFGNAVGWYNAGPLGMVEVISGKWTENDYERMLRQLLKTAAALPYSINTTASLPYERTALSEDDVLYHAFIYLRYIIGNPQNPQKALIGSLQSILSRPHRQSTRINQVVPTGQARRLSPQSLNDIACGRWPLRKASHLPISRYTNGLIPEYIEDSVLASDVNTIENRFIKNFLAFCTGIIRKMLRISQENPRIPTSIEKECHFMLAVLQPIVQNSLWKHVQRMTHFPSASTILHRRHDYRTIFGYYTKLRLGAHLPIAPANIQMFLEIKDIAELYEIWSCFALIAAVENVLGKPQKVNSIQYSEIEVTLRRSLQAVWSNGTEIYYNSHYSRSSSKNRYSYSLPLRPDIVLKIPSGLNAGQHIFDAKFKVETFTDPIKPDITPTEKRRFKSADLYKMHTYKDALNASTCWILYPGTEVCFFDQNAGKITDMQSLPASLLGVGGCILPPDEVGQDLQHIINHLLTGKENGTLSERQ